MRRIACLFLIIILTAGMSLSSRAVFAREGMPDLEADSRGGALCKLLITYQNGTTGEATGFIYGDRVLATAGHVLYDERYHRGGLIASLTVIPGVHGEYEPFGRITLTADNSSFHTPVNWVENGDWRADIGVVVADEPWDRRIQPLPLGDYEDYPAQELEDSVITLTGYAEGSFRASVSTGRTRMARDFDLLYGFTALPGESGSPVLSWDGEVVAIQNYAANRSRYRADAPENVYSSGARIQREVYDYLTQFVR